VAALFDSHCHLYAEQFHEDLNTVIDRAIERNVKQILLPGENFSTSLQALQLCANRTNIEFFVAAGIHPHYASSSKEDFIHLNELFKHGKVVAIGEIGLDYYWMRSEKEMQIEIFRKCLELALELEKPIVMHNREATDDFLLILNEWVEQIPAQTYLKTHPGVLHSYNGDPRIMDFALKNHFYLGISGPITFKNAMTLQAAVKNIPITKLLIETDSPYLAPHPHRGQRNEPANVWFIAEKLAEIIEIPLEKVIEQTTANAMELFRTN